MVFKTGSASFVDKLRLDKVCLQKRSVKHHGVFNVFQSASDEHAAAGLIPRAKALGYWTVSVLPDQLTWWVGSKLPFNENKSGPPDWRQLAISL